jgi:ATP-dependent helicase/nuclease subunit A
MNRLISASAGSGKTHALTTEYLRLLCAGQPAEAVLAATFTRKAAGEIFDRLLSRLASACLQDAARADLADALGTADLTQLECQTLLLSLCAGLGRLSVGTLDGFFGRLCAVSGLGTGLTNSKNPRCVALRRDALRAMLGQLPDDEVEGLLDALNQQTAGSAVISKFETLVMELSESLADAPLEAWDALQVPPPPAQTEIDASLETLRAEQGSIKDKNWQKAIANDIQQAENGHWEEFISKGIASKCLAGETEYYRKPISESLKSAYGILIGVARSELLGKLRQRTHAVRDVLAVFAQEDRRLRRAEGLTLFSEAPGLLLPHLGDLTEISRRIDTSLDHLLLDEFQDTSDAQWAVLRRFARRASDTGTVFVVGDVKQAIYGWRGGRAEIFERINTELEDMARESRHISFRSSPVILETVNQVFGALSQTPTLNEYGAARDRWSAHFLPHTAHHDRHGQVTLQETPADMDHGDWCAERICAAIAELPAEATVGVLVRRNATGTQMADHLRSLGVEVSSEGAGSVTDDPAVELILSALTLADDPRHTAAAFHVAHSPLARPLCLSPDLHTQPAESALVSQSLRRALLVKGYAGMLADWAAILAPYGTERTARRLEQLVDFAAEMDSLPSMRPCEFVQAARAHTAENPGAARVRVMTINRAKGLEFDAVFLPELDWSAFGQSPLCLTRRAEPQAPHSIAAIYRYPKENIRRLDSALEAAYRAKQDEEVTGMLCLLYVALTRARYTLHLYLEPPSKSGLTPAHLLRHALGEMLVQTPP